ncbi:MAG: NAD(P)-binding domain-containing protein [Pseudomonadales bacterium]
MTQRAGFIGLGNIGKPMAIQLAKSEFPTVVYDINPKACEELAAEGATIAASPAELAAQCHYIGIRVERRCRHPLPYCPVNTAFSRAQPNTVVAIHSTVKIDTIKKLAWQPRQKKAQVFDAPITGGAHGAASKQLYYMCGGDEAVIRSVEQYMLTSGQK